MINDRHPLARDWCVCITWNSQWCGGYINKQERKRTTPRVQHTPPMIYIGIDLSLNSTGISIYCPNSKSVHCYFYPHRQKDRNRVVTVRCVWGDGVLFHITPFQGFRINTQPLMERYHTIVGDLLRVVREHAPSADQARVYIEGYAFDAVSSSSSKLHELGGILKYRLYRNKYAYREIPPPDRKSVV